MNKLLKKTTTYTLLIGVLFFVGLHTHTFFLEKEAIKLQFSLFNIYLFHAVFTFILITIFTFISKYNTFFEQLGFIYLGTLVFKITFFCGVFYNPIFTTENLSIIERISLLIPVAIFLIIEVYFIAKILNRK